MKVNGVTYTCGVQVLALAASLSDEPVFHPITGQQFLHGCLSKVIGHFCRTLIRVPAEVNDPVRLWAIGEFPLRRRSRPKLVARLFCLPLPRKLPPLELFYLAMCLADKLVARYRFVLHGYVHIGTRGHPPHFYALTTAGKWKGPTRDRV